MSEWTGNPNSSNQLWSEWVFEVIEVGKHIDRLEVLDNARRWLRKGFGSVGRIRVLRKVTGWKIVAQLEGAMVNDPEFIESVRRQFQANFVTKGWGSMSFSDVYARVLSGNAENGRPPSQVVIVPTITR